MNEKKLTKKEIYAKYGIVYDMTDRQRAAAAHEKVLSALFERDKNPSYALSALCLENMTSAADVFLMEDYGFIKYVGGYNGNSTYQIRF